MYGSRLKHKFSLTDNDTGFQSTLFPQFASKWSFKLLFRCAYVASGNGIAKLCHKTVKQTAKRERRTRSLQSLSLSGLYDQGEV